jgi:hypothetical protein
LSWKFVPSFDRSASIGVFVVALVAALATIDRPGLVWDEPFYLTPKRAMSAWFGKAFGSAEERARALSPEGRRAGWLCCLRHPSPYVHPPLSSLFGLTGAHLLGDWFPNDPTGGHRIAGAALFAGSTATLFQLVRRRFGAPAGLASVGACLFQPHWFGFAKIATPDFTAAAFSFLAVVEAIRLLDSTASERTSRWIPLYLGLLGGSAFMSKAPAGVVAAMIVVVFVVRSAVAFILRSRFRDSAVDGLKSGSTNDPIDGPADRSWGRGRRFEIRIAKALLLATATAAAVVWFANPAWWTDPIRGISDFIAANREFQSHQRIKTTYLGVAYPSQLPWHNTLVLTFATTPASWSTLVGVAVAGLIGRSFGGRKRFLKLAADDVARQELERSRLTLTCQFAIGAATWMILRATPFTPGNDSVRHFIGMYPYLAGLVGVGAFETGCLIARLFLGDSSAEPRRSPIVQARVVAGVAIVSTALAVASALPFRGKELSYFSESVGGLPGATRLGLERTYFWDAVDDGLLAYMNRSLPRGAGIQTPQDLRIFEVYQQRGRLRPDLRFFFPRDRPEQSFEFAIIQARDGMLNDAMRALFEGPVEYEVTVQGVRLVALVKIR